MIIQNSKNELGQISREISRLERHAKDHDFKAIRDIRIKQGEQYSKAREFCRANKINWVEWLKSPNNSPLGHSQVYKLLVLFRYRDHLDDALAWFGELNTIPPALAPHKKKVGLTLDAVAAILVAHDRFQQGKLDLTGSEVAAQRIQRPSVKEALKAELSTSARLREELACVIALYEAVTGTTYQVADAKVGEVIPQAAPPSGNSEATPEGMAIGKHGWTNQMLQHFSAVLGGAGNADTLASGMQAAFGRPFGRLEIEWAKKRMRSVARSEVTQEEAA